MEIAKFNAGPFNQAVPALLPPRNISAVVRQARDALRRYRQDAAAGRVRQPEQQVQQEQAQQSPPPQALPQQPLLLLQQLEQQQQQQLSRPVRLVLQLPLPVASAAPPGMSPFDQSFGLLDESDWPGGIVQRFRALRPLVEATLEGYDPHFLGMLEDAVDGVGCWTLPDTTFCGIVTNATFSSFNKLCQGGYGSKPAQAGHTLVAINPEWTGPKDIGQPWDRKLKQAAAELLAPDTWSTLYSCRMVRTSRGRGFGMVVGAYGSGWHLFAASSDDSSSVKDRCLMHSWGQPEQAHVVEVLNQAAEVERQQQQQQQRQQ